MTKQKRRILILFSGGTLVMEKDLSGSLNISDQERAVAVIRDMEPRLFEKAELSVLFIDNIDSTNIQPSHWDRITEVIKENYDDYDGFVITHGTDTMAYTASALSFSMQNLGKPVILTGSQIPGSELETDARRNLVNAVRIALSDISGVYIVFDRKILKGTRTTKVSESRLDAFESVAIAPAGEIRVDVRLKPDTPRRHFRHPGFSPGFREDIAVILLFPGMPEKHLLEIVESDVSAIVLLGYGTGNIAYRYLKALERAKELEKPVIISSQCRDGSTSMHLYAVGMEAMKRGAIQAFDMSIEATVTKLMWILHRTSDPERIRKLMHADLSGEISVF